MKGDKIIFTDLFGKKILENIITENSEELSLNIKKLISGNYFINFQSGTKNITKKIIIN